MHGKFEFYKVMVTLIQKGSKNTWSLFLVFLFIFFNTCYAQPALPPSRWAVDASTKISLAFASQNNHQPESAFGHVFLIVHQQNPPEPNAQVIEYVGHLQSFGDMLATLYDRVDGRFRVLSFSERSLDYDLENRDLHLLELELESSQVHQLLEAVDLRLGITLPYTFAKYNCAYYLALVLEEQHLLKKPVSTQFYVEPVDLIKSIDEAKIRTRSFIPSSHRILGNFSSQLSVDQLHALHQFERGDDAALARKDLELNRAISALIRYQLPRESVAWRRQYYADAQKSVWHVVPKDAVSDPGADSSGHFQFSVFNGGAVGFKYQPELRNFFSLHSVDQAGAYLELLGVELIEDHGRVELNRFTLFKSESIHTDTYKSRLLEIEYKYWGFEANNSTREAYIKWGLGGAVDLMGLSLAFTPHITLAVTNDIEKNPNLRLGYRALAELHKTKFSLRLQTEHWLDSPFEFSQHEMVQVRVAVSKKTNLGLEVGKFPQLDRTYGRLLISHSL